MGRKKTEKMKEATAGLYIPPKRAAEMMAVVEDAGAPARFMDGMAVALGFLTTPENSPRHGQPFEEYATDFLFERVLDSIEDGVARDLRRAGIDADVRAVIVKGGDRG